MSKNTFDADLFRATLKVWRKLNNMSSVDTATLSSIAKSTYGFIEAGDRSPTMAEFSHLCELMDFDASYFFKAKGR